MIFIESPIFTADVVELLSDEDYAALQAYLVSDPDAGDLIVHTGGLRKVRWVTQARRQARRHTRDLLPRRCQVADPHDSDLSQRHKRRSDAKGEGCATQVERGLEAMNKRLFERLVESMEQHREIARGERAPSREFTVDAIAVKEIRALTQLSQPKFARILDVDVGTLRNWEQGRREPTGPAKALLRAIKNDPKAVLKALAS